MTIKELEEKMHGCEQTQGQSVLDHGKSVNRYYYDLIENQSQGWRIAQCITENFDFIRSNLHSKKVIDLYTVYHDCGKPFCLEIDREGRRHFPNHAQVSKDIFLKVFNVPDKEVIANLIGWDMVLHTSTANEINDLLKNEWSIKDAITLMLIALSEVHSNAAMFGGMDTVSFKSKWKKLERRCKQICKFYTSQN